MLTQPMRTTVIPIKHCYILDISALRPTSLHPKICISSSPSPPPCLSTFAPIRSTFSTTSALALKLFAPLNARAIPVSFLSLTNRLSALIRNPEKISIDQPSGIISSTCPTSNQPPNRSNNSPVRSTRSVTSSMRKNSCSR